MKIDFTQLKNHFQPPAVLALTVGLDRLAVRLVRPEGAALPPLSLDIPAAKLLENPVKAGAELLSALETASLRERRCVVCLPPSWALSASADMPQVEAQDLRGYFELRAEREFSTSDLRLAHSPFFLPEGTQRATLAALPVKRMEAVEKMLASAGCQAVSITLALEGCLSAAAPTLHLLAREGQTDVIVSSGGGIAAMRSLAVADPAAFARELRITLGRLPEAVRQHVRRARLVGPAHPGLRETLGQMGFEAVEEEPGEPGGAGVECAAFHLQKRPVPFEFFVPEISRWPATLERLNTRRGRQILGAALALVLLPLLAFIIRSHQESSLAEEWAGMKNSVADLEDIQKKVRQFRPWFEPGPQKLQALDTLISTFPERGDVWARSVQIGPFMEKGDGGGRAVQSAEAYKVSIAGFARSNAVLMTLQERLRKQPGISAVQPPQIRGNNPIQFSLSFKWEPKHE